MTDEQRELLLKAQQSLEAARLRVASWRSMRIDRALPVNDRHDRKLMISYGAAIFDVEVVAERLNIAADMTLLSDSGIVDDLLPYNGCRKCSGGKGRSRKGHTCRR
ncbi:hypothetical protein PN498_17170 [Oscillatoria sp. CS-180]|uniref:hypothetical protein n=1 Tax=Oscillatoria sp. CS-180 TaxID=3021720 RepID=UPI00232D8B01|nr:hypothetical protein [Oscillatoria sp. CS-180]MDB9527729.1 hypothetical protein [Oscillatoria sp. CS-180]